MPNLSDISSIIISLVISAVACGLLYYFFKQRLVVLERSQMEQARVLQTFIANINAQIQFLIHQKANKEPSNEELSICKLPEKNELIVVSSENSEDEDEDDDSSTSTESSDESDIEEDEVPKIKVMKMDNHMDDKPLECIEITKDNNEKKIIELDASALGLESDSCSSSESESESEEDKKEETKSKEFSVLASINFNNMSVVALKQLVKDKNLAEESEITKMKKKDLVQLLNDSSK